jgi:adenosylcobinamide-GDP ribazoletransferase
MRRAVIALQFMTRLPLPAVRAEGQDFSASMRWFPLAGLVVGGAVALAAWAGMRTDAVLGGLLGLIAWTAITGALHLDGLGDMADAVGAVHKGRERLSAVLADPHIGSFGVVAIGVQLLAKLVLLSLVLTRAPLWVLPVVCMIARIGPLIWTLTLPSLHDGLGAKFRGAVGWGHVALWTIPTLIAVWFVPGLAAGALLIPAWGWWIKARIGGVSGDGHGAGIECTESGLLLAVVMAAS